MKYLFFTLIFAMISTSRAEFIPFPEKEITSLLSMNSNEMRQYINSKDIDIFKFIDPLETLSQDIPYDFIASLGLVDHSKFDQYKDLFDGQTLGFYFSEHNPTVNLERDTIVISDKADRWTIAHEMGHALIDQKRLVHQKKNEQADLERLVNAKEDYEEAMSLYRKFDGFVSEAHMRRTFDSIKIWTTTIVNFLYNYELEEVRIERYLESLYETRADLKLDKNIYQRSFWYSGRNCTSAMGKLNNAVDVVDYFETIINDKYKNLMKEEIDKQKSILQAHHVSISSMCVTHLRLQ